MFVRKCEQLTASMVSRAFFRPEAREALTQIVLYMPQPETALPPPNSSSESHPSTPSLANGNTVPAVGLATNAAGAAGVLAGWAFGGVGKKVSLSRWQVERESPPDTSLS